MFEVMCRPHNNYLFFIVLALVVTGCKKNHSAPPPAPPALSSAKTISTFRFPSEKGTFGLHFANSYSRIHGADQRCLRIMARTAIPLLTRLPGKESGV
jgi:hypothetical protein